MAVNQVDLANSQGSLLQTQAWLQDKYHYYRNGTSAYQDFYDDLVVAANQGHQGAAQRVADVANRRANQLPRLANYVFNDWDRGRLYGVAWRKRSWFQAGQPIGMREAPLEHEAREVVRAEFRRAAQLMTSSFRYIKNLGYGPNGIMSLWRYQAPGAQDSHHFVMKMSTSWDQRERRGARGRLAPLVMLTDDIRTERAFVDRLARAPHIIQRFLVSDYMAAGPGTRRSSRLTGQATNIDNDNQGFYLMEYCKFGDLERQLFKAAKYANGQEQYLPSSVLWRFFDCLVKACMAMQCPPRQNPANYVPYLAFPGLLGPAPISGADLPEVTTVAPAGNEGIVHFDLNPSNIFLHNYDTPAAAAAAPGLGIPAHTGLPRLQVADFGLADNENTLWDNAYAPGRNPVDVLEARIHRWLSRGTGKQLYLLPEQFGSDWDRIPALQDPSDEVSIQQPLVQDWRPPWMPPWARPPPITAGPGRYTSASNVWQIGMTMKVCMTLHDPDQPPYAGRMTTEEPPAPVPIDQQRWTYGWQLLDPAEPWWLPLYQRPLVDLVCRCLMARQDFRPSLAQLQAIITANLALPANQNVPAFWTNTFFGDPQPPSPPEGTNTRRRDIDPFFDYRTGRAL
ncbi:hypothetical protein diail_5288 [Diaporthe ilicicola]|nr:hypothetical protein diail_5288 [Diaporthe ilicicola]